MLDVTYVSSTVTATYSHRTHLSAVKASHHLYHLHFHYHMPQNCGPNG